MKSLKIIILSMVLLLAWSQAEAAEPVMSDFTAYPPFLVSSPKPNVMILMDNSGSMFYWAYDFDGSSTSRGFDPSKDYYGYFDADQWYFYNSGSSLFEATASKASRIKAATEWDGNFLNWMTMRRIDVARKVLVGGKTDSRFDATPDYDLIAERADGQGRGYKKEVDNAQNYSPYSGTTMFTFSTGSSGTSKFKIGSSSYYYVKVHISDEPTGVIQIEGDNIRWGLAFYNNNDGGHIKESISNNNTDDVVYDVENTRPSTWTPLAEAFWTVTGYFAQDSTTSSSTGPRYYSSSSDSYSVGASTDPYNYGSAADPDYVECAKSFVIVITDGEPTKDRGLPSGIEGYSPTYTDGSSAVPSWAGPSDPNYFWYGSNDGSHYIDDVAMYSRVDLSKGEYRDLRSGLDGQQYLTSYFMYASFGNASPDGQRLLQQAARNGAFEDNNGNFVPDLPEEYDRDEDGIPDAYFEAENGEEMATSLAETIVDILRRTSSGTAVSILSTSAHGEGSLFQAYFKPEDVSFMSGNTARASWIGYLHGLWVDSHGNLREDNGDRKLVYAEDNIIGFYYTDEEGTKVQRDHVSSSNPFGDGNWEETNISLDDMQSMWEGGEELALRDISSLPRKIYTPDLSTRSSLVDFKSSDASSFQNYLRASTVTEASEIMEFISGEDVPGMRSRLVYVDTDGDGSGDTPGTWRLGDIIYSTPAVVSRPMENYDNIYRDETFGEFEKKYSLASGASSVPRPTTIFVGANDGMLHAFNAGSYFMGNDDASGDVEHGRYEERYPSYYTSALGHTPDIGEEIWAFIPHNVLPHLRWLTDENYTHVYYVDLKSKIADVRIFSSDSTHPNGWGTVLIGGLRFGGGSYEVTDFDQDGNPDAGYAFSSCYYALDITNPAAPVLLWEFTVPNNMGFTTSYPAIARVGDAADTGDWYVVLGTGPTTYEGDRPSSYSLSRDTTFTATTNRSPALYVLDLKTGTIMNRMSGSPFQANGFFGAAATMDMNLDFQSNAVYIGETYQSGGAWAGKMFRVLIGTPDEAVYSGPSSWSASLLASTQSGQALVAPPAIASDHNNIPWVYFGSGRYFSEDDKVDTSTQSFYGVKDRTLADGTAAEAKSFGDLIDVSNVTVTYGAPNSTVSGSSVVGSGSTWENMLTEMRGNETSPTYGWYLDATDISGSGTGERILEKPSVFGGMAMFSSFMPVNDVCRVGGQGRLYAVYYETGTAFATDAFSLNDPSAGTTLEDSLDLGSGKPSSLAIHIGQESGGKIYVQQSTGAIKEITINTAFNPKSGSVIWYER